MPRIRFHLAADVLDMRVNRAIERFTSLTADGIEELSARENAAGMTRQGA